jgi:hypothetical protein
MQLDFRADEIPLHWFDDNVVATHALNGLNLIFPDGERFFIRSVKHFLPQIQDEELRVAARAFFQQEAFHGQAHERCFELLEAQGFEIRDWLAWYRKLAFRTIEPKLSPTLNLSVTAALEHLTATIAHHGFTEPDLRDAHPTMAALLLWHGAEEIEHKSVAFDVLAEVDGRYPVRAAGMVLGLTSLLVFSGLAARHLAEQDAAATPERITADRERLRKRKNATRTRRLARAALQYLRPSFHPDQIDDRHLASDYLSSIGRLSA